MQALRTLTLAAALCHVMPLYAASSQTTALGLFPEIADWLVANFDLPAPREAPRVAFASQRRLAAIRYGAQAGHQREVLAVYDDKTGTVLLRETWTAADAADVSVLVHEMVHHLQNQAGLTYACAAAREKLAYQAQDAWLKRSGTSLEAAFEIDPMTLLLSGSCYR